LILKAFRLIIDYQDKKKKSGNEAGLPTVKDYSFSKEQEVSSNEVL